MRRARAIMELWPWAGLAGAGLAWTLAHQVGSDGIFYDCSSASLITMVAGALALLLTGASGAASFRLWRAHDETAARRFVALLGWLFSLLLGLAVLLPMLAAIILPECLA